jgi:predicted Holliday junction resolvase-like endonuclease
MTVLAWIVLAVAIVILSVRVRRLRRDFEAHEGKVWKAHAAHEEREDELERSLDTLYGDIVSPFDTRRH